MSPEIKNLQDRIAKLEKIILERESPVPYQNKIRDIVFPNKDAQTLLSTTISVVTSVNFGASTVTTANVTSVGVPDSFLQTYFRGKIQIVPAYNPT